MLLALLGGGVYSFVSLSTANRWLRHTGEVRISVAQLAATLLDAETGLRGYLFTGTDEFLAPYDQAGARWSVLVNEVRRLTSDNPEQQARVQALEALIGKEFGGFTRARAEAERVRAVGDARPLLSEHKRAMDAARVLLASMEAEEASLDQIREHETTRRWGITSFLLIGGAFAFVSVVAGMTVRGRTAELRRRRVEEEQRLLQAVFAGIDDGITLLDRTGRLVFANAAAARVLGFASPAALLTASPLEIVSRFEIRDEAGNPLPPDQLPSRAVFAGSPMATTTIRYRTGQSGPWRWSIVQAHPIFDADGKVIQAINVFRDVTAEREADERQRFLLRAADELSSSLDYEATLAAIARLAVPVLADWCGVDVVEDGRLKRLATAHIDPNKLASAIELQKRYPPDPNAATGAYEIVRTGKSQLMPNIPRELLTAAAIDEEHLRLIDELELRSYMGVPLVTGGRVLGAITFVMAESYRSYGDADLAFARALADRAASAIENARLFREVETARAEIAARLAGEERRRAEAEEQTRFAETFVGMLGHDLRNPLNAILMTTRLLRRMVAGAKETNAVERVHASATRMSNMVTQLLDLTRSRLAGGIRIEKTALDVGEAISEVVDELRRGYPTREIAWTPEGGVRMDADRDRLAQLLSNLIGNAVEHGDPACPVRVHLSGHGGAVTLSVHNEGPTIAPDRLPFLFEPFGRNGARSERSKGLGLGLYITEQIVRAHGGRIEVTSAAGHGTAFVVIFPRADVESVAPAPERLVS